MADSDHTTSLSAVTRRTLLVGTMMATVGWPLFTKPSLAANSAGASAPDLAVSLWREWLAAYRKMELLCRQQQQLETRLVKEVGFPRAVVRLPGEPDAVSIFSAEELESLMRTDPQTTGMRDQALADLTAHQARWDAADERLGYSAAEQAEKRAAIQEQELADALCATPAFTLAGVAAKLDVTLRQGEPCEGSSEFPWPQIRSALHDLIHIGRLRHFPTPASAD